MATPKIYPPIAPISDPNATWSSSGTGNRNWRVVSASDSVLATDEVIVTTGNAAAVTLALPAANTVVAGHSFTFKDGDGTASTKNLTIARSSTDLIDGQTSQILVANYSSITIVCDGSSKFYII